MKESCPGEEPCAATGRIWIARAQQGAELPILDVCDICPLQETKPGSEPPHLTMFIVTALDLDEAKQAGAVFPYPDALSVSEWICIRALQRARSSEEEARLKGMEKETQGQTDRARLEQMRRR